MIKNHGFEDILTNTFSLFFLQAINYSLDGPNSNAFSFLVINLLPCPSVLCSFNRVNVIDL